MKINFVSTNSLIINFGEIISKEVSSKVQNAYALIKNKHDPALIEIIPSYTTLFISYDIFVYDYDKLKTKLSNLLKNKNISHSKKIKKEIVNIDVYYGTEVGYDLEHISKVKNISIQEIISLHTQKAYDVYAIGFLPGFGFLGQVNEKISLPRLQSPRKKVPKGSVAIANNQTAVYPKHSAGGWNIIGRTSKELFDKTLDGLSPLNVGKQVKFNAITKKEFLNSGGKLC